MGEKKFQGKIEELPFLGSTVLGYFDRDRSMFSDLSPVYNDEFRSGFQAQVDLITEVISPKALTAHMKSLTKSVNNGYKSTRNMLNKVSRYLAMADGTLTMAASDFGIQSVRKQLKSKNVEGVVKELRTLYANLDDNKDKLEAKGYTAAIRSNFENLIKDISATSLAKSKKLNDREKVVQQNMGQFVKLWNIIGDVMQSGKTIAKEKEDKSMLKDYTFSELQKTVRKMRKKEDGDDGENENGATPNKA